MMGKGNKSLAMSPTQGPTIVPTCTQYPTDSNHQLGRNKFANHLIVWVMGFLRGGHRHRAPKVSGVSGEVEGLAMILF